MKKRVKKILIFTFILALTLPILSFGILNLSNHINVKQKDSYVEIQPSEIILKEEAFLDGMRNNFTIEKNGNFRIENDKSWTIKTSSSRPRARTGHSMVYDSMHDQVILFGGMYINLNNDNEIWVYNFTDNTWINMNPTTRPSSRWDHSMVYDSTHDQVILFGGYDDDFDDETWIYNFTDNSWTNMNPATRPSTRDSHSMVYDSTHDQVILFGGYKHGGNDETWIYNFTDNSWTNMNPATKPGVMSDHSMVYDSTHDLVILYGWGTTWIYNFTDNSWINTNQTTGPSSGRDDSMVYDSMHDQVILFGGVNILNDETWIYNFNNNSWINMNLTINPGERWSHSMVYDSMHDQVILFGGQDMDNFYDDTWIYNFNNNSWTNIIKNSSTPILGYDLIILIPSYCILIIGLIIKIMRKKKKF